MNKNEKGNQAADEQALVQQGNTAVSTTAQKPRGFEDEEDSDVIIPRVKLVQDLSPERKEKIADSGDIINSLTKEKLEGMQFIPVFKFNNNIEWKNRADGGGIICRSQDGKSGKMSDGTIKMCATCRRCEFANDKQGKDAIPACTKYINFFGFFEGVHIPIVLSFCKTYYNEGKKMYSMAKFTMEDMWNKGYYIDSVEKSKNGNDWFALTAKSGTSSSAEDRAFAEEIYEMFRNSAVKFDVEEGTTPEEADNGIDSSMASEI